MEYFFGAKPEVKEMKPCASNQGSRPEMLIKDPSYLECVSNRIFYYAGIDTEKVLQLNKQLYEMELSHLRSKDMLGLKEDIPIFLHISSYGGTIHAGIMAMDQMIRTKVPVITTVDGCCASAATFLSIVGSHRRINRNAVMLIHQLSGGAWGNYAQMTDSTKNMDMLMKKIKEIYKKYTKVPQKKLDEILSHDIWWEAEKCLEYGLVDEII